MDITKKIEVLSKVYNYTENKKAINIIEKLNYEESVLILNNPLVQNAIFKITDQYVLRTIFRKSPEFFQLIMFSNKQIQDLLIAPRKSLKPCDVFNYYHKRDWSFLDTEVRELEVFLHTIKSPDIFNMLVDNKFFQTVIPLFTVRQIKKSFFKDIDEVKLFNNIVSDEEIYKKIRFRQKNVIEIFNKVSPHILLPDNYLEVVDDPSYLIKSKEWKFSSEKVIIDDKTLSILTYELIEALLDLKNIDQAKILEFLKEEINNKLKINGGDLTKIFPFLINNKSASNIDYVYFTYISEKIITDVIIKEKLLDFMFLNLCKNYNFTDAEKTLIKQAFLRKLQNKEISKKIFINLFNYPDTLKTIFYLRTNVTALRMNYLNGIEIRQLFNLNIKHLNQIVEALKIPNEDELSNTYSLAIKMYLVFGLEKTLNILNGKYGKIDRYFYDNVSRLDVKNIALVKEGNKYIPKLNNQFLNFMFASKDSNHFVDMLNNKSSYLYKNWCYLFNNFSQIKEKCHDNVTLKKVNIILKKQLGENDISDVTPNNYKLTENDILNDICLGNKTSKKNSEIYNEVLNVYNNMKKRYESSIPYIKGKCENGYTYEMMHLTDPIAFTLGYKGNCCIRICDIAHDHLLHATLCRNGRILIIYNENHEFAAFVPLKRNGEVLIANSIECLHKIKDTKAIIAFSSAINDIINVSKNNEDNPIKLVCIGHCAYAKPLGEPFPRNIKTPTIYEKNDLKYANTDCYHKTLDIIYKDPTLELEKIKYANPICSYKDPKPGIKSCDFVKATSVNIEDALKIINAVRYENATIKELENFDLCRKYHFSKAFYGIDWYIVITHDGKIYGDYLKFNPEAEIEFNNFCQVMCSSYEDIQKYNLQKVRR